MKVAKGRWVTINGTHVFIGGNGRITKGPAHLIGLKKDTASTIDKKVSKVSRTSLSYGEHESNEKHLNTFRRGKNKITLTDSDRDIYAKQTIRKRIIDSSGGRVLHEGRKNLGNKSSITGHIARTASKYIDEPNGKTKFNNYVAELMYGEQIQSQKAAPIFGGSGKVDRSKSSGNTLLDTLSRQSNPATVKTMGEFLRATHAPATARTRKRGGNK